MKKYRVEFTYHDRTQRGFQLKKGRRTVKANSEVEAIQKVEASIQASLIKPTVSEAN